MGQGARTSQTRSRRPSKGPEICRLFLPNAPTHRIRRGLDRPGLHRGVLVVRARVVLDTGHWTLVPPQPRQSTAGTPRIRPGCGLLPSPWQGRRPKIPAAAASSKLRRSAGCPSRTRMRVRSSMGPWLGRRSRKPCMGRGCLSSYIPAAPGGASMGQRLAVSTLAENTILRGLARSVGASKGLARWIHQVGGVRETTVPGKSPCSTSFLCPLLGGSLSRTRGQPDGIALVCSSIFRDPV